MSIAVWFLLFAIVVVTIQIIRNKNIPSPKIYETDEIEEFQTNVAKTVLEQFNSEVLEILKKYINPLILKSEQLTYKDEYGDYIFDDWHDEIKKFMENISFQFLSHPMLYHFDKTELLT